MTKLGILKFKKYKEARKGRPLRASITPRLCRTAQWTLKTS